MSFTTGMTMSPESFARWLIDMQERGLAKSDAECGRLLGITSRQILNMKRNGAPHQTALACAALLKKLKPYE